MSVYSSVRESIRRVALVALSEFTNPQVVFSHANGTEPAESYVVINLLSITQQGHASTSSLTNPDKSIAIQAYYEAFVQFTFVGSKSGEMIQSFTQRINNNPLSLQALQANNLGLMRKSAIRNSPQRRDTKWIDYHNMDVTFNYIVNTEQVVDWVESVVVDSEQTGEFTIPDEIVVP